MKKLLVPFLAFSISGLTGCASMFQGTSQNITVATINDKNVTQTRCNIKNEEGAWTAAPNSAVSVHRDGNSMEIQCENELQNGLSHAEPDFNGGYFGLDLLLDLCTISCIVDGANNAFYQYPAFITVPMTEKNTR